MKLLRSFDSFSARQTEGFWFVRLTYVSIVIAVSKSRNLQGPQFEKQLNLREHLKLASVKIFDIGS